MEPVDCLPLSPDISRESVPVSLVARVNQVLIAHPSFEANTVNQLVTLAKANPGKLMALGVADDKRSVQLPDVPTFAEQGFPGYAVYSWYAVVAPAGTPDAVVKKLHAAFSAAVRDPGVVDRLTNTQGMTVLNAPGEDLLRFMQAEQKRYADPIRLSGAKIE